MLKRFCDICEKEMHKEDEFVYPSEHGYRIYHNDKRVDACEDCIKALTEWMNQRMAKKEVQDDD